MSLLFWTAMPAFIVGMIHVIVLGKLGINQLPYFMVLMPLLMCAWFYFLGWLIDRWRYKRARAS